MWNFCRWSQTAESRLFPSAVCVVLWAETKLTGLQARCPKNWELCHMSLSNSIFAGVKEEVNVVVVVFLKGTGKNCALSPAELYQGKKRSIGLVHTRKLTLV